MNDNQYIVNNYIEYFFLIYILFLKVFSKINQAYNNTKNYLNKKGI